MKKLIVLLIIMVYGFTSTGAIVHLDYCCGKLLDISLFPIQSDDCDSDAVSANSCCDSKHVILKVKGEQEVMMKWIGTLKQLGSSIEKSPEVYPVVRHLSPSQHSLTSPPDPPSSDPLYIQLCVFRI